MKKLLALLIVLVICAVAAFSLCACNFDSDGVTVEFYSTMGKKLASVVDTYIKEFNKIYPKINIKHTIPTGSYDTLNDRLKKELKVSNGPSVTYCYSDHVAGYNQTNKVVSLNKYIYSTENVPVGKFGNTEEQPIGVNPSVYIDGFYEEGYKAFGGDTVYTIPFLKSSEVLYYNKDFFDAHSDVLPDLSTVVLHWFSEDADDHESMEYVCKTIKELDPECYPLGYDSDSNFFITMCAQYQRMTGADDTVELYTAPSGDRYVFDNDVTKGFVLKFNEWYQNKWLQTQGTYENFTSGLFTSSTEPKSYMCIGSTGGSTYQVPSGGAFETGIAMIPQMDAEHPCVISQGPSVCILNNKNCKTEDQKLAAWLWIKFLTTNLDFQANLSMQSGYVPVIKAVQDDEIYIEEFLDNSNGSEYIAAQAVKQCLAQANAYFVSYAFGGSSEARTQVGTLMTNCITAKPTESKTLIQQINEAFAAAVNICEYYAPSSRQ